MKRWLVAITVVFIVEFIVVSSVSLNAQAQVPLTSQAPAATADVAAVPVQAAQPVPTPAATPPIVGRNEDPVPKSVPASALPAGYPGTTQPALQQNTVRAPIRAIVSPTVQPLPGLPPKMVEQPNTKSEILSILPPVAKAPELRAVLRTSVGDITIRLDRANATRTADYFVGLARGDIDFTDIKTSKPVKRPFYNGLIFHRVVKNTLIQTGDPFGTGRGGSGTVIPDEIKPSMKFDRPGLVAMAPMREGHGTTLAKNSASSQFFITLREMPEWNGQFTIFGVVEDGMDVVKKISDSKVGPTERPIKRIYLVAVEIIESNK